MIMTRPLNVAGSLLVAAVLPGLAYSQEAAPTPADSAAKEQGGEKEEEVDPSVNTVWGANTLGIQWGEYWGGSEIDARDIEDQVTLVMMWGGDASGRGIVPGLIELSRKYRDAPLKVVCSYMHLGKSGTVLEMLRSKGWKEDLKNFSVQQKTHYRHADDIKEVNIHPYYFLFDHFGKLRYHHVAGEANGGNGDAYREQVALLVRGAKKDQDPSSYLTKVREWTNNRGTKIEAALIEVTGDEQVRFRKKDGNIFQYPLKNLSKESRKAIKDLLAGF